MEQVRAKRAVRVLSPADLAVLLIALLATGLRLYHLGAQGLDWDEGFGIGSAYAGFGAIIHTALTVEPHPPLFYSFLRVWYHLAGTSEFALRLPSVMSSTLVVPLLFALCRRLFLPGFGGRSRRTQGGPWVGVLSGLLWALSAEQVWYAQEERMYAPAALLCLAAVYLALRALQAPSTPVLVCWSGVVLVALYLHYWSTFIFVLLNAFVLGSCLLRRSRLTARAWLLAQIAPVLLFFPWLAAAYRSTRFSLHVVDVPGELTTALRLYTVGPSFPRFALAGSLFFAGLLAVGLATSWLVALRGRSGTVRGRAARAAGAAVPAAALLTLYAAGPLVLGLMASEVRSVFAARYLMISAPAFCVLFALGVAALWRQLPALGLLSLALAAVIDGAALWNHYFNPAYLKDPFPGAVQYVDQHLRPGDAVILDSWDQQGQFWYYHVLRAGNPAPSFQFPLAGPDAASATPRELGNIMSQHGGVWVLNWDLAPIDARRAVQTQLATHDFQALSQAVGSNSIEYYAAAGAPARTVPIGGICAGNLQLRDEQVFHTRLAPGAVLPAAADWTALRSGLPEYMVSWRLMDAAGNVVWQRDSEPNAGFSPTSAWTAGQQVTDHLGIPLPVDLQPASYELGLVLYDKASGHACQLSGQSGPLVPLQQVQVTTAMPERALAPLPTLRPAAVRNQGLELIGWDVSPGPVQAGATLLVQLRWQAAGAMSADLAPLLQLRAASGATVAQATVLPGGARYPTSRWPRGRVVQSDVTLHVPAGAAAGGYSLRLELPGTPPVVFAGFPPLLVQAPARSFAMPTIASRLNARFNGQVLLLGSSLPAAVSNGSLTPGQTLALTVYWQDLRPLAASLKVFLHLETPAGQIIAQDDGYPAAGTLPTLTWMPTQIITDPHRLLIPAGAHAGSAVLTAGLYDPSNGTRLTLAGSSTGAAVLARPRIG